MATVRKDTIQLSIEINGVKAGTTFTQLKTQARDLARELDKLAPGSDAFIKKSEELKKVNNVLADIRNTTRGIASSLEAPRTGMERLTDLFKKGAAAAAGYFAIQRVAQWGKEFVGWISQGTVALESMERKTAIVFGDAIDIVEDYAASNAAAIGVTETKYKSLAAGIADILIPMKFEREEAAELASGLTNLTGALTEWDTQQRSASEIANIVSKSLTGERDGLKSLGIVINEADISSRLLEKGQSKLTGTMLQQAKAMATYELLLEKSQDAQTSFAVNTDSAGRSVSRITASWEKFKENILSGVLPAFRAVANVVANIVSPLKRQSDQVTDLQVRYNVLVDTLKSGKVTEETRIKLIERINEVNKKYGADLITLTTSNEELAAAQAKVNAEFQKEITLLAAKEKLIDINKKLLDLKAEELDLATDLTAATNKVNEFDISKVGQGREGADQAFIKAATAAQAFTDKLEANQSAQEATRKKFDDIAAAARALGVDIAAILNGPGTDDPAKPKGDPDAARKKALKQIEERFRLEELLQLQSIEDLRDNDELYQSERERIALETSVKIATAQSELYKTETLERLQLEQKAADDIAKLQSNADKLSITQRLEQIDREQTIRITAISEELEQGSISLAESLRERETLEKESALRIARVRAQALVPDSAAAQAAAQDIQQKEDELNQYRKESAVKSKEEEIELSRQIAIQGLESLKLEEEDLQKSREVINREADIRILETRLALYKKGTQEALEIENQLADLRRQRAGGGGFLADVPDGGLFSTPDDRNTELDQRAQIEQAGLDLTEQFAQQGLEIKQQAIDEELQSRLEAISTTEEAALAAAEGDAALQKKIHSDAAKQRLAAEKQAARERQGIARKEAVIQGALAFIKALPNYVAAAAAAAASIFQIAQIDSQKFYEGGPTGRKGLYRDSSGHDVAGVVHTDEYVVPKKVLDLPSARPHVDYLERLRMKKKGFVDGGFTSISTRPVIPSSTNVSATASIDSQRLDQVIAQLDQLIKVTSAWPRELRAKVVLTELETASSELDYIRRQSVV